MNSGISVADIVVIKSDDVVTARSPPVENIVQDEPIIHHDNNLFDTVARLSEAVGLLAQAMPMTESARVAIAEITPQLSEIKQGGKIL
jgi:hypothetical protein